MSEFLSTIKNYIRPLSESAQEYVPSLSLDGLGLGVIVFAFILLAFFLFGLSFGKSKLAVSILSLYVALLIETNFIYFADIKKYAPNISEGNAHLLFFAVFFLSIFILLSHSSVEERLSMSEVSIFSAALLGIVQIGFLASIIFRYIPTTFAEYCPKYLAVYFVGASAQFWWMILPVVALAFIRRNDY